MTVIRFVIIKVKIKIKILMKVYGFIFNQSLIILLINYDLVIKVSTLGIKFFNNGPIKEGYFAS